MRNLVLITIFTIVGLSVNNSYALSPVTAAKLAENIEKKSESDTDGFKLINTQIARPYGDATDEIKAELWQNDATNEAIIVLHTKKVEGITQLMGIARKFFTLDQTIAYTREQGRIYNDLVKQKYPELAGGLTQQIAANVVSGAISGVYGVGRGLGYLFGKGKEVVMGKAIEVPADEAQAEIQINQIDKKLMDQVIALYKKMNAELRGFSGKKYVVGHCLAGYYAQYLAYREQLDGGYSFGAIGIGLDEERAAKGDAFVNYHRASDKFRDLYPHHYGRMNVIDDLPLTVVDNLQGQINSLKVKDSATTRTSIMSEYLSKNHAIDGYADQIAKKASPEQKRRAEPVSVSSSSNAVVEPVKAPTPPPMPSAKKEVSNNNNDNDDGDAPVVKAPPMPAPKMPPKKAAAAKADPNALFSEIKDGFKLRKTDGPKEKEIVGGVVRDEDPITRQYRAEINDPKKLTYADPGKKFATLHAPKEYLDKLVNDMTIELGTEGLDAARKDDLQKRIQVLRDIKKGLK